MSVRTRIAETLTAALVARGAVAVAAMTTLVTVVEAGKKWK